VLVGINTLLLDNPQLNARDVLPGVPTPPQQLQPRSVILDSTLRFCRGSTTSLRVQVCSISPNPLIIMTLTTTTNANANLFLT
jgi:riboflavin biosynthesis pyrimidine reductase